MIVLGKDRFSEDLARQLKAKFMKIESKIFPDGESYARIPEPEKIRDGKVILAGRLNTPGHDQDKLLMETFLILDKIRDLNPGKTCCLLPYQPYARQDRVFLEGETNSVKTVRGMITENCDLLVNVSAHDFRREGWISEKAYNIDATDSAIEFLKGMKPEKPVVIAPDMTESEHAGKIAASIGGEHISIRKERDKSTGKLSFGDLPLSMKGRQVIIYDDIISSGGTMINAINAAKKAGASRIVPVAIHGLSCARDNRYSLDIVYFAGQCLYLSDTIQAPYTRFSVTDLAADRISKIF